MDSIKNVGSTARLAQADFDKAGKEPPKRIFLGAGINKYANIGDLSYCVKDTEDMKSSLEGNPLWENGTIQLLQDSEATKEGIRNGISQYAGQLTSQDTFFFCFSGHGTNWQGKSYFCPQDTDTRNPDSLVSPEELADWFKSLAQDPSKPPKVVVSMDSCFSGGFARTKSLYPSSKLTSRFAPMEESLEYAEDNFTEVLSDELSSSYDNIKGAKIPGLANAEIYAASRANETSLEDPELENGDFTHFWVEGSGLGSDLGPAESDNNEKMSASEIYKYTAPKVESFTNGAQHPTKKDNCKGEIWLKAKEDIFPK